MTARLLLSEDLYWRSRIIWSETTRVATLGTDLPATAPVQCTINTLQRLPEQTTVKRAGDRGRVAATCPLPHPKYVAHSLICSQRYALYVFCAEHGMRSTWDWTSAGLPAMAPRRPDWSHAISIPVQCICMFELVELCVSDVIRSAYSLQ